MSGAVGAMCRQSSVSVATVRRSLVSRYSYISSNFCPDVASILEKRKNTVFNVM